MKAQPLKETPIVGFRLAVLPKQRLLTGATTSVLSEWPIAGRFPSSVNFCSLLAAFEL